MAATAFPYARVSVPSPVAPDLLRGPCLPRLLLARLSGARPARPLDGVIGPQDGRASIALPQWRRRDFLPLGLPPRKRGDPGCAHSSRAKKACPREGGGLAAAILRCAPALRVRRRSPAACRSPSRPRWSRARTAKEKRHGNHRFLQEVRQ